MRSLLIAALVTSVLPTPTTEACGDYGQPRAFMLSSHRMFDQAAESWGSRSFVILSEGVSEYERLAWSRLAPGTYDSSQIAPASDLTYDQRFTLVGPGGRRVVTSRSRWYLDSAWQPRGKATVLEVDGGRREFAIALSGKVDDATWLALDSRTSTKLDRNWITAQGVVTQDAYVYVSRLHGTTFETVSVYPAGAKTMVTFVRSATGENLGQLEGSALGGVTVHGRSFVLAERGGIVTQREI